MPRHGNLAFYEAAAQVIPLAFIALAIEMRVFQHRDENTRSPLLDALARGVLVMSLTVGEGAALAALYSGVASEWHEVLVLIGLTTGAGAIPFVFLAVSLMRVPGRWGRLLESAVPLGLWLAGMLLALVVALR